MVNEADIARIHDFLAESNVSKTEGSVLKGLRGPVMKSGQVFAKPNDNPIEERVVYGYVVKCLDLEKPHVTVGGAHLGLRLRTCGATGTGLHNTIRA